MNILSLIPFANAEKRDQDDYNCNNEQANTEHCSDNHSLKHEIDDIIMIMKLNTRVSLSVGKMLVTVEKK